MHCPHCNQEHSDSVRFCPTTGKPLRIEAQICPHCGQTLKELKPFCPYCGESLSQPTTKLPQEEVLSGAMDRPTKPSTPSFAKPLVAKKTAVGPRILPIMLALFALLAVVLVVGGLLIFSPQWLSLLLPRTITPSPLPPPISSPLAQTTLTAGALVPPSTYTASPTTTFLVTSTPVISLTLTATARPALDLAFVSNREGDFRLYLLDTNHPQSWKTIPLPPEYETFSWPSFCGSSIAYEANDRQLTLPRWVYLTDLSQETVQPLNFPESVASRATTPSCSPQGHYLAFLGFRGLEWFLGISDLTKNRLVFEQNQGKNPTFSPVSWWANEEAFLWMSVRPSGYFDIQLTQGFTNPAEVQTQWIANGKYPSISPQGNYIAYFCGNMSALCVAEWPNLNTIYQQPINYFAKIDGKQVAATVAWSSDGVWLYFTSSVTGNWDIFRMHPDGGELQNLTANSTAHELMPTAR